MGGRRAAEAAASQAAIPAVAMTARPQIGSASPTRPRAEGKFLFVGEEKLYVRGVTYGTFAPRAPTDDGYEPAVAERDFTSMRAHGINAIRLYSVPPRWLLDLAAAHGLWVLAGIPWEQHVTFLDQQRIRKQIEERVRVGARACAGHPALLGIAVGNEIPAQIVRWHGAKPVEQFIDRLCHIAREEDPDALITYVNYPSTEYLRLRAVDFTAFNVYLEDAARFDSYLARLQNLAADQPLVIAEVGLDSRRNGLAQQASLVASQVRASFDRGASGTFVFTWTDDWVRTGVEVRDWDFGLTTRDRSPKPALASVARAYADAPFAAATDWPEISVVLCSYNGERVIGDCLDGLAALDYPSYEVIVIDDGSTDRTAEIAAKYPFRLVRTVNRGLSAARNEGLAQARGEIVAYIDDDAVPDRHWLRYLGAAFASSEHVGIGGPNVAPATDTRMESLLARAPGTPIHVLRTGEEAEHIPGCNSAYRTEALRELGGWDTTFRVAGDDVDLCWRIHERGGTLGFAAGAMVWHRRRGTLRSYLRQQRGYGRAEALLERKWPSRFNRLGHVSWPGQLYGPSLPPGPWTRSRRYHGQWGAADYQSLYQPGASVASLPLMPEWYLLLGGLGLASLLGLIWFPLLAALVPVSIAAAATAAFAMMSGRESVDGPPRRLRGVTAPLTLALVFVLQPLARLTGRIEFGLTPWRRRASGRPVLPHSRELTSWSEEWHSMPARLRSIEERLRGRGAATRRGGPFDRWDLELRLGAFGGARLRGVPEEHGAGRQLLRYRIWPTVSIVASVIGLTLLAVAGMAAIDGSAMVALALLAGALVVLGRVVVDAGSAVRTAIQAVPA